MTEDDQGLSRERVFKKSAPNNKLTIYLSSRDLVISDNQIDKVQGVVLVDPEYLQDKKVYGQVTLTFRYGREDEEVMGLKFCNEAIMCIAQLYPIHERAIPQPTTPLQDALIKRLGPNARPFTMEVTSLAPPSVQLVPAKEYCGAPIGTSYDVRAYVAEYPDEKLHRRSTVRMAIRVVQRAAAPPAPLNIGFGEIPRPLKLQGSIGPPPPHATVDKPFLLSDGRVELEASLNRAIYSNSEPVLVNVTLRNNSHKTIRRIKVFVVQHVDVCMFSNGKFKNVVALINSREECPLGPSSSLNKTYTLHPEKGATKNWIALEDSFNKIAASLAPTVTCASNSPEDRNIFAIYVSYYVKVKVLVGAMGGVLALKLPFTLMYSSQDLDQNCYSMSPSPLICSPEELQQALPSSTKHQKDDSKEHKDETTISTSEDTDKLIKGEDENSIAKISQKDSQKCLTKDKIQGVQSVLDENGGTNQRDTKDLNKVSSLSTPVEESSTNECAKLISAPNLQRSVETNVIECEEESALPAGIEGTMRKEGDDIVVVPVIEGKGTKILSKGTGNLKTLQGERRKTFTKEDEDMIVKCEPEPT